MKKKFIPLLYQIPMVQACLQERKTKTRRTKGLKYINVKPDEWDYSGCTSENFDIPHPIDQGRKGAPWYGWHASSRAHSNELGYVDQCPYGMPGDVLYVREAFSPYTIEDVDGEGNDQHGFIYKANKEDVEVMMLMDEGQWKPGIHMPFEAVRMWLEVISVTVERLHEITEEDAKLEGVSDQEDYPNYPRNFKICPACGGDGTHSSFCENYGVTEVDCSTCDTYKKRFKILWNNINGNWDANPWVWVVEFKKVEKPAEWDIYVKAKRLQPLIRAVEKKTGEKIIAVTGH